MLFRTLDAVLGSTAKIRLLRALLALSSPVSRREAQLLSGIRSVSGLRAALHDLAELGIVERQDTRRIKLFRINREHDLVQPLAALFEAENRRVAALRRALQDILDGGTVRERSLSIILFGSNARGDARPTSDADLFVVAADEPSVPRVREVLVAAIPDIQRRFGLRISPLVLARERIQERYRDGDPLMKNIETEGRALYGTHFQEVVGLW